MLVALTVILQQVAPDTLTLRQALELAGTRRPVVQMVAANVARARAGVRVAGGVPNPIAGYSYTEDTPRQHLSLEQSFEWLLTRGPDRAASRSDFRRSLADSSQAAVELAAEVRLAFYGAIAAGELARVAAEQRTLADSLVTIARARYAQGDIAVLEREQLQLEATRVAQQSNRLIEEHEIARQRLVLATGWSGVPDELILGGSLSDGLQEERDSAVPPMTPRVAAAIADSAASVARLQSAHRAGVPLPSLVTGADWDEPGTSHGALAVIGFSIPLPLWQRGGAREAVAEAEADRSRATVAEARRLAHQDLGESITRLQYAEQRALVARDSLLPLARRIRRRAITSYQSGESGLVALLDALRSERECAAEAVVDLLAWQAARTAWYLARGRTE